LPSADHLRDADYVEDLTLRIRMGRRGIWAGAVAFLTVMFGFSGPVAAGQATAPLTETALFSHMNSAARRIRTVSTQLAYTTVTVLVNVRSTENGTLYYRKGHHRPEVRIQFSAPDAKDIVFRKGTAEIYYPKINQIQVYDLARHQNLLQQFLLLGFGTDTTELESSYALHYLGVKMLGNQATYLLELAPLSKDVAAQLNKVDLWISSRNWLPIQQEFFEASGDYLIARYSKMKINLPMSPSTFKIRAPGAERVRMG
jgi:outer membrane lipoprotein-sorting protein